MEKNVDREKQVICYAGKELINKVTFDEDKDPNWQDEAQNILDYHKKNNRSACIIHEGVKHTLFAEI